MTTKTCTKCHRDLPLTAFGKHSGIKSGLNPSCLECNRARGRKYYQDNREKVEQRIQEYKESDPERYRAMRSKIARKYYLNNRDERTSAGRARYRNKREEILEARRKYRQDHIEKERERDRQYRMNTPDLQLMRKARYRSQGSVEIALVSVEAVLNKHGHRCYLCDRELKRHEVTFDHVLPLSRGGPHVEQNLRPCCKSCNTSKGTALWTELQDRRPEFAERIRKALA